MPSKHYRKIKKAVPAEPVDLPTAASFLKQHARGSFDETIELHVFLGIDPAKSEQMVRGNVVLPAGAVKKQTIIVFSDDKEQQAQAVKAGAAGAGSDELITEIEQSGKLSADIAIATPAMMPRLAKVARILGPKGLMPNPKTGTVTDDPAAAVSELAGGKVSFKMDQLGNVHAAIAKTSWEQEKIVDNAGAFLKALKEAKPASTKGDFIKSVTLKSTMSPGVRVAGK